ncbi:MAG TPA: hypothetical protein DEF21_03190 [Thalassospira lucentensis]|uniref:Uncharacterized protein n=1 Tax=Thalassospira lucentensis TaxID=168935 RepID=A0A358HNZ1_9PROT|nr:hypothetical protein [Thalassospira lucentensis]HCW66098.1 hypothetical protein [Thalassospira lucentensis]
MGQGCQQRFDHERCRCGCG